MKKTRENENCDEKNTCVLGVKNICLISGEWVAEKIQKINTYRLDRYQRQLCIYHKVGHFLNYSIEMFKSSKHFTIDNTK